MTDSLALLCSTAGLVALLHTLLGPDHYLPFLAMSRAGHWSFRKTMFVTLLCGVGHVLSSVLVGCVGIAAGLSVFQLDRVEAFRSEVAGWLLLAFGGVYLAYGLRYAARHHSHVHWHAHADGDVHSHPHVHTGGHVHVHSPVDATAGAEVPPTNLTPWILFTVFVFGPCEVLIPLLIYPAAVGGVWDVVAVALVFGLVTLATMLLVVAGGQYFLSPISFRHVERFGHAIAGFVVLVCGLSIQFGL